MEKQIDIEEAVEKARGAVELMEKMLGVHVPASLKEALKEEWASAAMEAGNEYLEHVSKEEIAEWNKRVMTVEAAQDICADFENEMVKHYTNSPSEIFLLELAKNAKRLEFFAGHAGEMIIVARSLMEGIPGLLTTVGTSIGTFAALWFEGKVFGEDEDDEVLKEMRRVSENVVTDVVSPVWNAVETIIAGSIIELVQAIGTAEAIGKGVVPVVKMRNSAIEAAKSKALPQSKGPRVRRRKRSSC